MKLTYFTALFGAVTAAGAIAAAPVAAADTGQSCSADGSGSICQSPGSTMPLRPSTSIRTGETAFCSEAAAFASVGK
ncbi:MAG: hypothetical protein JWR48_2648 [Mycobacterium sp.]|nr:hypothetical protein [Mycobacterium sp.]